MRISVVIPAYRAERFLANALQSVQAQTVRPHEIIVVDDGSADATARVGRECGADVVVLPGNQGVSAARNEGVRRSTGEVVALLDADDQWMPEHLEILRSLLLRHPQAAVAFARARLHGDLDMLTRILLPDDQTSDAFLASATANLAQPSASAIRRDAFDAVGGFDEAYRWGEDFDFWLRLARNHLYVNTHIVTSLYYVSLAGKARRKAADLEWQCRSRFRMWLSLEDPGEAERRMALGRVMQERWEEILRNAWSEADVATFDRIIALSDLVPGSEDTLRNWQRKRRWFRVREGWNALPPVLREGIKSLRARSTLR